MLLTAVAATPTHLVAGQFDRSTLDRAEGVAPFVLAHLHGEARGLARPALQAMGGRIATWCGWGFGFASCVATLAEVAVGGATLFAASSMLAASGGFGVAAYQHDKQHHAELDRQEALLALDEQIRVVRVALDRLRLVRIGVVAAASPGSAATTEPPGPID